MKRQVGILLLLVSMMAISACGQSGDLYLPEDDQTQEKSKK